MYKKIFIAFEGIDGSGKTMHSLAMAKKIKSLKIPCVYIREPGGSKEAESIRKFLLSKTSRNFDSLTDTLLYLAARNENFLNNIKKYYKKKVIICDRFTDSTIAYQHYGFGVNKKIINIINKEITRRIKPDYTFLLNVNIKESLLRTSKKLKNNRYDKFSASFYSKVQKGFLKISKSKKRKYMVIDSTKKFKDNQKIIFNKINSLM